MRLRVERDNAEATTQSSLDGNDSGNVEPMSPMTECFMSEGLSMYILAAFESEVPIDVASIHLFLKNDFVPVHHRFSSIPINQGRNMWKRVEVDVRDHMKIPILPEELTVENYTQHFNDYLNNIANQNIRQDIPLWELHIFKYPIKNAAGVLIFKLHHSIADGVSLMGAVFSFCRRADDPSLPLTFPSKTRTNSRENRSAIRVMLNAFSGIPKCLYSFFSSWYYFGQSLRTIISPDDQTPIKSGNAELGPVAIGVCTVTLALKDVKTIKDFLGVTVNDVLVGTIFLGTRLYMREMNEGQLKNSRTTAAMPVNSRAGAKGFSYASSEEMRKDNAQVPWGNRFSSIDLSIPNLDEDDFKNPLKVVMKAHKTIMKKKNATFAHFLMAGLVSAVKMFAGMQGAIRVFERKLRNSSMGITNMVGPIEQVSLGNHRINGFYFTPAWKYSFLNVSFMSYMESLRIGLSFEEGFTDQQKLTASIQNAFQLIFQAAGGT